jgi:hypothetical protein
VLSPRDPAPAGVPTARQIDSSCPQGLVPAGTFLDVPAGSTHERAIACLVWWKVANGRTSTDFVPFGGVNRDAMATFVARAIVASGGSLPADPPNAFTDDDGSVHARAIDQLAAVGIIGGTGGGAYTPGAVVNRGQMARFLANALAHRLGASLPPAANYFPDDDGSRFEADIDRVAALGITGGRSDGSYDPAGLVSRDQMASFLARVLDVLVDGELAVVPAG